MSTIKLSDFGNCKFKPMALQTVMDNPIHAHFVAALAHIVSKGGHGEQVRLAGKACVSTVHLNDVLKGRKIPSPDFQGKMASAIGMNYEDMLSLGRHILAGGKPEEWAASAPTQHTGGEMEDLKNELEKERLRRDLTKAELDRANEIIDILKRQIDDHKGQIDDLRRRDQRHEQRIADLEEQLKNAAEKTEDAQMQCEAMRLKMATMEAEARGKQQQQQKAA